MYEQEFVFGRHTGVTVEPRCQIADWNPADARLTVHHSQQAPHMMQDLYCRQFDLQESQVRVICKDVGGSFGIKVHAYPDDFATVAIAILLQRPVKFVADRLESFTSDIHAREHVIKGRIAANAQGDITAFEIDDLTGIGPYSMFPRTSGIEGNQVVNLTGGVRTSTPITVRPWRVVVFQNKTPPCQYRGVGASDCLRRHRRAGGRAGPQTQASTPSSSDCAMSSPTMRIRPPAPRASSWKCCRTKPA